MTIGGKPNAMWAHIDVLDEDDEDDEDDEGNRVVVAVCLFLLTAASSMQNEGT